jgi:hypothetical protein
MHTNDILILYLKEEALHFTIVRFVARGDLEINLMALLFASHSLFLSLEKQFFIESAEVTLIA